MPGLEIIAIAVGLGADAMSVCMGVGVRWHGPRQRFRLAWHMGLFQAIMPIAGWFAGSRLAGALRDVGAYVAAALLFAVGLKMLIEALRARPGEVAERVVDWERKHLRLRSKDPTRGWSLVGLSVATSIDALVVGVSLGLRGREIWVSSLIIGAVAALMALTGVGIGRRVGKALGRPAEALGALVLMILAIVFLFC